MSAKFVEISGLTQSTYIDRHMIFCDQYPSLAFPAGKVPRKFELEGARSKIGKASDQYSDQFVGLTYRRNICRNSRFLARFLAIIAISPQNCADFHDIDYKHQKLNESIYELSKIVFINLFLGTQEIDINIVSL